MTDPETLRGAVAAALRITGAVLWLYIAGYATVAAVSAAVGAVSLHRNRRSALPPDGREIAVSLVIPAFNESVTLVDAVRSLLRLRYSRYEIVVVDDGSTDETARRLIESFHLAPVAFSPAGPIPAKPVFAAYGAECAGVRLTLLQKANGGRADAVNAGVNAARYPYYLCLDADSVLDPDALLNITRPVLLDPRTVAVGGAICPENERANFLTGIQAAEYDRAFLISRIFFDRLDGTLLISGAFGLFRRSAVIGVGGYSTETLGEDMELIMRMRTVQAREKRDWRLHYTAQAVCRTQVPEHLRDLCGQRRRWHIGLMQNLRMHGVRLLRGAGGTSWFTLAVYVLYELLPPYLAAATVSLLLLALFVGVLAPWPLLLLALLDAGFSAALTLAAVSANALLQTRPFTLRVFLRTAALSFAEFAVIKPVLTLVRVAAIPRRGAKWGVIRRQKLQ